MNNNLVTYVRSYGARAAAAVAAFFVGAVAILWCWTTIAVEYFSAPPIGFRHALAAELAVAVLAVIFGMVHRIAAGGPKTGAAA